MAVAVNWYWFSAVLVTCAPLSFGSTAETLLPCGSTVMVVVAVWPSALLTVLLGTVTVGACCFSVTVTFWVAVLPAASVAVMV